MSNKEVIDSYPVSPMQQGMLLHSLSGQQGGGPYIQQLICRFSESIDEISLFKAWQQVLERHSILRTAFRWKGISQPIQDVYARVRVPYEMEDWRDFPPYLQQKMLEDHLAADRKRGFDVTRPPLMRLALFKLGDSDCRMVWTFHHALLDGRSHFLVLRELLDSYDALCEGRPQNLKDPRPYRQYIEWLAEQDMAEAEAFWRHSLSGFHTTTSLRAGTSRVSVHHTEQQHATIEIRLAEELTAELRQRAQENDVTLNTLLQASWALLLSSYSGEEEVLFGATRACRHWTPEGADSMVGLFINTLPLRVVVRREQQLTAWLKELRLQQVAFRNYEHTALMKIKAWSDVPRGTPLFDTLLVFEDYQMDKRLRALNGKWTGRDFELLEQNDYSLTLAAYADSDLLLKLEYDQGQFDSVTIRRMLEQLQTLLEGMAKNLKGRVGTLSLLTAGERRQLLIEWNQTTGSSSDQSLPERFEQQVKQTPDGIALVFENEAMTYRELNERANKLAHYLRQRGIGPEVLVALYFERSPEMIVGVLGTLKAGGAYVPLDSAYPADRISLMLEDAGARILLTHECLREKLPMHELDVIAVDGDWETIVNNSSENPENTCRPQNLAYVIYTSGSTGKPKGVAVTHENVMRLFETTHASFNFNQDDVWTLFHSYAFDFSVWELWGALLNGGRVVIVPYWVSRSPQDFYRLLCAEKVTVLNQTPSAFRQLIAAESMISQRDFPADGLALRLVIFGGEALDLTSLRGWWERHGDEQPQLVNMYGITETTVHVTYRPLGKGDRTEEGNPSGSVIGCPLGDLQVYILDAYQNLTPIGMQGELFVGGAGLSRGYLRRPELTAERFVPHPFSEEAGSRLYKTGDIGRYLPSGEIEYLGRSDRQVKVRGFRVEPGEIESVLTGHHSVRQCVVMIRDYESNRDNLIAYIVASNGSNDAEELRSFLREKLPEYMIPATFIYLDDLPLTPNGKIDRRALPASDSSGRGSKQIFIAPDTRTEDLLSGIWSAVLKLDAVGRDDNFFDLGGNSLLATQVISRVRDAFLLEVPVRGLFENPRLREFSELIDRRSRDSKNVPSPTLAPLAREARSLQESGLSQTSLIHPKLKVSNGD